jgi:hypothetical protein
MGHLRAGSPQVGFSARQSTVAFLHRALALAMNAGSFAGFGLQQGGLPSELLGVGAQALGPQHVGRHLSFELCATTRIVSRLTIETFEILSSRLTAIGGLGGGHPVRR